MTKAIGALAAIILVGRDLVSLDTPVTSVLPDFHEIQVLETIGRDGPVLRPPQRPVTLRHLLKNTSGFAYPAWHKKQAIWQLVAGAPHPVTGTLASLKSPLMFDPGRTSPTASATTGSPSSSSDSTAGESTASVRRRSLTRCEWPTPPSNRTLRASDSPT